MEYPEVIATTHEREFSIRWAKENPILFAERVYYFFADNPNCQYNSRITDGFITFIAEKDC